MPVVNPDILDPSIGVPSATISKTEIELFVGDSEDIIISGTNGSVVTRASVLPYDNEIVNVTQTFPMGTFTITGLEPGTTTVSFSVTLSRAGNAITGTSVVQVKVKPLRMATSYKISNETNIGNIIMNPFTNIKSKYVSSLSSYNYKELLPLADRSFVKSNSDAAWGHKVIDTGYYYKNYKNTTTDKKELIPISDPLGCPYFDIEQVRTDSLAKATVDKPLYIKYNSTTGDIQTSRNKSTWSNLFNNSDPKWKGVFVALQGGGGAGGNSSCCWLLYNSTGGIIHRFIATSGSGGGGGGFMIVYLNLAELPNIVLELKAGKGGKCNSIVTKAEVYTDDSGNNPISPACVDFTNNLSHAFINLDDDGNCPSPESGEESTISIVNEDNNSVTPIGWANGGAAGKQIPIDTSVKPYSIYTSYYNAEHQRLGGSGGICAVKPIYKHIIQQISSCHGKAGGTRGRAGILDWSGAGLTLTSIPTLGGEPGWLPDTMSNSLSTVDKIEAHDQSRITSSQPYMWKYGCDFAPWTDENGKWEDCWTSPALQKNVAGGGFGGAAFLSKFNSEPVILKDIGYGTGGYGGTSMLFNHELANISDLFGIYPASDGRDGIVYILTPVDKNE